MRIQGSIITVVDPSKCQASIRKIKALDVQMLTDAPSPLQLSASNDMNSSTAVFLCCITLSTNKVNLDNVVLGVERFVSPLYHFCVLLCSTSMFQFRSRTFKIEMKCYLLLLMFSTRIIIHVQFNTITECYPAVGYTRPTK